jgi:beta-lactamase class A
VDAKACRNVKSVEKLRLDARLTRSRRVNAGASPQLPHQRRITMARKSRKHIMKFGKTSYRCAMKTIKRTFGKRRTSRHVYCAKIKK